MTANTDEPPEWMDGELAVEDWARSRGIRRELRAALRARRKAKPKPPAAEGARDQPPG
jgi:hypothetical protein